MTELTRQEYNLKILKIVEKAIKENPNLRFYQVLSVLELNHNEDNYYEESKKTYIKLMEILNGIGYFDTNK